MEHYKYHRTKTYHDSGQYSNRVLPGSQLPANQAAMFAGVLAPDHTKTKPAGITARQALDPVSQPWLTAPAARPLATFSHPVTRTRQPIASSTAPAHLLPSTTSRRRQDGNGWSSGL